MSDECVNCPALNRSIDFGYCQELQMASDNEILWNELEDCFDRAQYSICANCINRITPKTILPQ